MDPWAWTLLEKAKVDFDESVAMMHAVSAMKNSKYIYDHEPVTLSYIINSAPTHFDLSKKLYLDFKKAQEVINTLKAEVRSRVCCKYALLCFLVYCSSSASVRVILLKGSIHS